MILLKVFLAFRLGSDVAAAPSLFVIVAMVVVAVLLVVITLTVVGTLNGTVGGDKRWIQKGQKVE